MKSIGTINPEPREYNFYLRYPKIQENNLETPKITWARIENSEFKGYYNQAEEKPVWWLQLEIFIERINETREIAVSFIPKIIETEDGLYVPVAITSDRTRILRVNEDAIEKHGSIMVKKKIKVIKVRRLWVGEPHEEPTYRVIQKSNEKLKQHKKTIDTDEVRRLKDLAMKIPDYFLQKVITDKQLKEYLIKLPKMRKMQKIREIIEEYQHEWYSVYPSEPVKTKVTGRPVFKNGQYIGCKA
jgi:hypothetical protein